MNLFPDLFTDPAYLRQRQYANAANLDARVALHLRFSTNPYGWMRWVFDHLLEWAPGDEMAALEFGCGPAHLWRENIQRIPPGWQVTLSDLSPGMVEEARQALATSERAFTLRVVDVQDAPFGDASFDMVVANHMLYHVPNREKAIAEARRLLRPGGVFVAATNGPEHLQELADLCSEFKLPVDMWRPGLTGGFSLENGAEQLRRAFDHVTLAVYDDGLLLTEAEPVVAYIDSMAHMDAGQRTQFHRFVSEKLQANHGAISVVKSSGLFKAW